MVNTVFGPIFMTPVAIEGGKLVLSGQDETGGHRNQGRRAVPSGNQGGRAVPSGNQGGRVGPSG
jgi:hypothetical protein